MTGAGRADAGSTSSRGHRPRGQPGWWGSPAVRAQSRALAWPRGARDGSRTPGPGPSAAAGRRPARGGQRRPTHMAGTEGAGLGSCRNGGSRWLRLALATGDGKMAAARHPHPGTAGGGGAQWRLVRVGPRGRGAAGRWACLLSLCTFRSLTPAASAHLPLFFLARPEPAQPPHRLCHLHPTVSLNPKPRPPSYRNLNQSALRTAQGLILHPAPNAW